MGPGLRRGDPVGGEGTARTPKLDVIPAKAGTQRYPHTRCVGAASRDGPRPSARGWQPSGQVDASGGRRPRRMSKSKATDRRGVCPSRVVRRVGEAHASPAGREFMAWPERISGSSPAPPPDPGTVSPRARSTVCRHTGRFRAGRSPARRQVVVDRGWSPGRGGCRRRGPPSLTRGEGLPAQVWARTGTTADPPNLRGTDHSS